VLRPRRSRLVAAAFALALLPIAAEAAGSEGIGRPYDSGDLTSATLDLPDLPEGWVEARPSDPQAPAVGWCNGPPAPARADQAGMISMIAVAFVGDPELGPRIDENIYLFRGRADARKFFSSSERLILGCKSYNTLSTSDPPIISATSSARLRFPELGHQSFAVRNDRTTTKPGVDPWVEELVYVRLDNAVIVLGVSAGDVEKGAFEPIARAAVLRLRTMR
jgi:hypothetical protein